jgi:hypothetical protein
VPFEEPEFPRRRVVGRLEQGPLGVAGHKDGRQSKLVNEFQRPLRERSPREVAAKDDNIGLRVSDLGEDRFESNRISVDIRDYGDAVSGKRIGHVTRLFAYDESSERFVRGRIGRGGLRSRCSSLVSSPFGRTSPSEVLSPLAHGDVPLKISMITPTSPSRRGSHKTSPLEGLEADDGTRTHDLLHGKRERPFAPVRSNDLFAGLSVQASERERTRANAEPCHSCHGDSGSFDSARRLTLWRSAIRELAAVLFERVAREFERGLPGERDPRRPGGRPHG